jgi:hypothetical protein
MKRLLLSLLFVFLSLNGFCQTLEDFNKAHRHTITYDENFTSILNLTVKNVAHKEISTIEITITFDRDPLDWTTGPEQKVIQLRLAPGKSDTIHLKVPYKNMKKPNGFWISRVRYSDGSICDK